MTGKGSGEHVGPVQPDYRTGDRNLDPERGIGDLSRINEPESLGGSQPGKDTLSEGGPGAGAFVGEPKPGAAGAEGGGLGSDGFRHDEDEIADPYAGDLAGGSASLEATGSGKIRHVEAGGGFTPASTRGSSLEGGANTGYGTAAARDPTISNEPGSANADAERTQPSGGSPGE